MPGPVKANGTSVCSGSSPRSASDPIREARENGSDERLAPFVLTGPGIARQGNPVVGGGEVTSGTLSPSLDVGIGLAYLPTARAVEGERFEIDVRGRTRPAEVRAKPLYRKEG